MAGEGALIFWVATHRRHHQHSDCEGDPHSPNLYGSNYLSRLRGLWHSHIGWMYNQAVADATSYARDLLRDPTMRWVSRNYIWVVVLGLAVPAVVAGLLANSWVGVAQGLFWAGFFRMFLAHHFTWSVNSICHSFGRHEYDTGDQSRNNVWLAIPTLGEAWHNNHHNSPSAAFFCRRWWQIDIGAGVIRALELVGLAWDVKRVKSEDFARVEIDPDRALPPPPANAEKAGNNETAVSSLREVVSTTLIRWLRSEVNAQIEKVDYDLPFTAAGLDSIGSSVVALEIEKATGLRIGPDNIYQYPTVNSLAVYLSARISENTPSNASQFAEDSKPAVGPTKSLSGELAEFPAPGNQRGFAAHASTNRNGRLPGSKLLDAAHQRIIDGEVDDAFWRLMTGLRVIRATSPADQWAAFIETCLAHPVCKLLHQEPYSRRGFSQPRGYPGDAGLIDYLYLSGPAPREEVTELGIALHRAAMHTPSGYSVRHRRDFAATLIDEVATKIPQAAIMSIACGYLREAGRSKALQSYQVGRFLAIDQDPESVRTVREEWSIHGVETRCLSIADLMRTEDELGKFDLIYALGLYDYLSAGAACRLTLDLFRFLNKGGTLLIANFVPGCIEAGYMEAFMRWHLIYRTPGELRAVCDLIPKDEIAALDVWLEDARNIAYLSIVRN